MRKFRASHEDSSRAPTSRAQKMTENDLSARVTVESAFSMRRVYDATDRSLSAMSVSMRDRRAYIEIL